MQYNFLYFIVLSVVLLIIILGIIANKKKSSLLKTRTNVSLEKIYTLHAITCEYDFFQEVWINLAKSVNMPPTKLYPEDTINTIKDFFYLSDLIYEPLEDFFIQYDVSGDYFSENVTIIDIVKAICNQLPQKS